MKKLCAGLLLVAAAGSTLADPVSVAGKTYDVVGRIAVKATGVCYGHAASGNGVSKQDIYATIGLGQDSAGGAFTWSNDSLMPAGTSATGTITERNGNRLDMQFDGDLINGGAGSILFALANIPDSNTGDGVVSFDKYDFHANVSKAKVNGVATTKIKVTESVTSSLKMVSVPCSFKWTVKRVMTGVEKPAT